MGLKGAGAFCLFLFEEGHQPEVKTLIKELGDKAHKQLDWNAPQANKLYAWYHITNAFFQEGGKNWKLWTRSFQKLLRKQQNPAGYWDYPGTFFGKSGKDIEDKVHSTVFCSLMLTSFYRYPAISEQKIDEDHEYDGVYEYDEGHEHDSQE